MTQEKNAEGLPGRLVRSAGFSHFMTAVILFNAFTIGLQTYHGVLADLQSRTTLDIQMLLDVADWTVVSLFTLEMLARIAVQGRSYFREGWNLFDAGVVIISLVSQSPVLSALRVLRVMRVLRLLAHFRSLRLISSVILQSLSGCVSITFLMLVMLFVFAVIGHELFGATHPELFGNLHVAMYSLFRVAAFYALDDVAGTLIKEHPWAYLYLTPYFILMSYVVINFFSAIVVYYLYEFSFEELRRGQAEKEAESEATGGLAGHHLSVEHYHTLMAEIGSLREEIRSLKS